MKRSRRTARLAILIAAAVLAGLPGARQSTAQTPPNPGTAPAAAAVAPAAVPATPGATPPPPTRLRPSMATPMRAPTNAPGAGPAGVRPIPGGPGGIPGGPGGPGGAAPAAGAEAGAEDGETVNMTPEEAAALQEGDLVTLNLPNAPLETALELYAGLVHRVLLRPPQLAGGPINLKFTDLTREEAIEALNGVFALNAISVIPVGEKFVKVVPSQQAPQEGAKATDQAADTFSELGQFVTKLVKVTKVKPGDIAQAVQQFQSGKIQNAVLAFDDQNFFVLRDMSANVKRMIELIKELDVTPELDYKLEVIPIRYGKVDEIYETLNGVLTGSSSGGFGSSRSGSTRASGFRSGGTGSGTGTGLGNNALGQPNSPFSSQQNSASRSGMTSPGAARSSLSDRLRSVTAGATGGGGGAQFNILENARIIPDMRSNSLLVYASKEEFKMLTNIVAKIDTLLAQVLIESIILEVGIDTGKDVGVSMVQNPKQFGDWTGTGASLNKATIATNILSSVFQSGFSYFGQFNEDFTVGVRAIETDSRAKVLARPRIQTTHAQPAMFAIGDTVPYPRTSSYGYGGGIGTGYSPYTTYDEKEVLTRLSVTPFITPDGLVTLEVEQTIDQLGPTVKVGQDEVPTIRKREASAVLSVRDGEPVILGGFITDRANDSVSGVPWLKDVPLLGWAFRSKSSTKQRAELIVLIRPTVLHTPNEASKLAELERRSLPNAAAAVREFQEKEAQMARDLGVIPGSTNALPDSSESSSKSKKSSRRKKDQ